jgi:hypothetical protein
LRLCLDRIIPPRRQRAQRLDLPPMRSIADLGNTMAAIAITASKNKSSRRQSITNWRQVAP